MNRFAQLCIATVLSCGITVTASAQDVYEQYYGLGVHAYFAGNYELAQEHFDELVNAGSQDPRVYYFRGLTQIRAQGGCMIEAGMPDFEQAAQLEVSGKRSADIGRALARIQGPTRIAIERLRIKARLAARIQQGDSMPTPSAPSMQGGAMQGGASPIDPYAPGADVNGSDPKPMPSPSDDAPANPLSPFDNTPAPDATMPAPDATMPAPDTSNPFGDDPAAPAPAPTAPSPLDNPFGT